MEVTMQWWDTADDWWFALRLRLDASEYLASPVARLAVLAAAALMLF